MPPFAVAVTDVDAPESAALLRAYFTELVVRYHRRGTTEAEVDEAIAAEPSTDLVAPTGVFLVLRDGAGSPVGCVGLRVLEADLMELTRMFVLPVARRTGAARALLAVAERAARDRGARAIRLETRRDLVEAIALYAGAGYQRIPAYSGGPYSDHWFEKPLTGLC
ncbi:MAG TPA: GNAT family N-acetyltransferase [Pseudonocardiaceae bacterium]|nr:GNAT family N-acetyltransferase [Pseudonocardiaceae bacterium]